MANVDTVASRGRIDLADEREFDLGEMMVKPAECLVLMNGERLDVQPRVMQVLVALAKARPDVVSRDKLIQLCWGGRIVGDDAVNRCVLALRHLAQQFEPPPFEIETVPRVGHRLVENGQTDETSRHRNQPKLLVASVAAVLLLASVGVLLARSVGWPWPKTRPPVVLVTAGATDADSRRLARDVAEELASFQTVQSAPMQLITNAESVSDKPDLSLQVGQTGASRANLLLTTGQGQSILWSRNFEQTPRNVAGLKQQVAVVAAQVLGCADEAMASLDRLTQRGLKTYLAACSALEGDDANSEAIFGMLQGVVRNAPRFGAAWAKLLRAETGGLDFYEPAPQQAFNLRRDILQARKADAGMPEAYLAETFLLPKSDFLAKERLIKAALAHSPTNASAHLAYAMFLGTVGRLSEAVQESREAMKLDPLAPRVRDEYVTDLAVAGRLEAAQEALTESERLWPGASSLLDSRYRLNLRFGDPRDALHMLQSGQVDYPAANIQSSFLKARIDPSPSDVNRAIDDAHIVMRNNLQAIDGPLQTLAQFGRNDEIFRRLLSSEYEGSVDLLAGVIFRPAFRDIHRDPRFMLVAKRLGLLSYWRTTGEWPDFCYAADLPYDCKSEAAKIRDQG